MRYSIHGLWKLLAVRLDPGVVNYNYIHVLARITSTVRLSIIMHDHVYIGSELIETKWQLLEQLVRRGLFRSSVKA